MREEDTSEYWDKKWAYGQDRRERVILDGSDGEKEFDKELRLRTAGKIVLDVGCGRGDFTLRIAAKAKEVNGVDISTTALRQAEGRLVRSKLTNVEFDLEDAGNLSFPKNTFDVVYSRRGPGSDSAQTLLEAYRVLRKKGVFMEITIGERDKQNLARIFGRGQMLGVKRQVSMKKKEMLEKADFTKVVTRDYLGTEVFRTMSDLLVRLRSAPIIPAFDARRDRRFLKSVQRECLTDRGIETPVHR
ncbi:MAG TPA: class I SAM-dependent methyltransferase [Candidatus Bathyarchaeia archaeon]|nr:class I SAM-dependent methyltransferase [Candidatus Bathyarchaeia archaeon]